MTPAERRKDQLKTVAAIISILVTIGIFLYGFRGMQQKDAILSVSPRYTIGGITRTSYVIGPSSEKVVFFVYRVRDSVYTGSVSGTPVNGQERVLIKFAAQQPRVYKAYNYVPIPNSANEAPPEGWVEPPFPVPLDVHE